MFMRATLYVSTLYVRSVMWSLAIAELAITILQYKTTQDHSQVVPLMHTKKRLTERRWFHGKETREPVVRDLAPRLTEGV